MRRNKLALYVHLVWATWDRLPLITPRIQEPLYQCIQSEARKMQCIVLALNGTEDHIHLVLAVPPTVTISDVVKQIKGASSFFVNQALKPQEQFKWQGSYGAFSVSRWDVDRAIQYVSRQREHHGVPHLLEEWEETFEEVAD